MDWHQLRQWWHSIRTFSYWKYTLLSGDSVKTFLSVWGAIWLCLETLEFFRPHTLELKSAGIYFLSAAVLWVIWTRRPVTRICYKLPNKDAKIEVRVADIFNVAGDLVISTNTTFDTDTASGLISPKSIQGKFTELYYDGNVQNLDQDIQNALTSYTPETIASPAGKDQKYKIGTVAKIRAKNRIFYLLAMADINTHGTAQSNAIYIKTALKELWDFLSTRGELGEVVLPLLGTGRGRTNITREETIKMIVTSFAQAILQKRFATKLTIVIHPDDYREYDLNLFELHDYLRAVHKYERSE